MCRICCQIYTDSPDDLSDIGRDYGYNQISVCIENTSLNYCNLIGAPNSTDAHVSSVFESS